MPQRLRVASPVSQQRGQMQPKFDNLGAALHRRGQLPNHRVFSHRHLPYVPQLARARQSAHALSMFAHLDSDRQRDPGLCVVYWGCLLGRWCQVDPAGAKCARSAARPAIAKRIDHPARDSILCPRAEKGRRC